MELYTSLLLDIDATCLDDNCSRCPQGMAVSFTFKDRSPCLLKIAYLWNDRMKTDGEQFFDPKI